MSDLAADIDCSLRFSIGSITIHSDYNKTLCVCHSSVKNFSFLQLNFKNFIHISSFQSDRTQWVINYFDSVSIDVVKTIGEERNEMKYDACHRHKSHRLLLFRGYFSTRLVCIDTSDS